MEVYLDDIKTDSIGGFDRVQPGSFHMCVVKLDEEGGDKGEMIVDFEILRGTTPNQEGKVQREYFSKDQKPLPRKKFLALALACGIITKEQLEDHKKAGTAPNIDFSQCVGRQCCGNFELNEYNNKVSTKLRYDELFHVTDKRAGHIPLNVGMLQRAGITLPPNRHPDGVLAADFSKPTGQAKSTAAAPAGGSAAPTIDSVLSGVTF